MSGALKNAEAGIAVSELQVWLLILFLFYFILFYFIQFYTFTWLLSWQILLVLFPPSLLLSRGKERVEENVFSYLKKYKFNPGQQKSWLQVLSMPRTHKDMMLRGLIEKPKNTFHHITYHSQEKKCWFRLLSQYLTPCGSSHSCIFSFLPEANKTQFAPLHEPACLLLRGRRMYMYVRQPVCMERLCPCTDNFSNAREECAVWKEMVFIQVAGRVTWTSQSLLP